MLSCELILTTQTGAMLKQRYKFGDSPGKFVETHIFIPARKQKRVENA